MIFLKFIFVVIATLAIALNAVAQDNSCIQLSGYCDSTKKCCPNLVCWTSTSRCVTDTSTDLLDTVNQTLDETQTVAEGIFPTVLT